MENPPTRDWKEEAELLKSTIDELCNGYSNSDRSAHLKDFENLKGKIGKAYKEKNSLDFCKLVAQEVERRYLERVDQWCGSKTISLFKENKTPASFVNELNNKLDDHHYSRMLGLVLCEMLQKEGYTPAFFGHYEKLKAANVTAINMPASDVYAGLRFNRKMPGFSSTSETASKPDDDPFAGFDAVRPGYNSRKSSK